LRQRLGSQPRLSSLSLGLTAAETAGTLYGPDLAGLAPLYWYSYTIAMRFIADREVAAWLDGLEGSREDFDWDAGNRGKNRKHDVEDEDIETILAHPVLLAGRIVQPSHDELRWLVLGRDGRQRSLALIFTRRGRRVRPISCRPMRRTERQVYEEAIGGAN
jgi:uncharacterized protein